MRIIESIRNYIKTCPYLSEFSKGINVDFLDENTVSYSIEDVPAKPILKKYVDGSSKRQHLFIFTSRESYGSDVFQNIENSGFYEDFSNWIELKNNKGELPILEVDKESIKIETLTTGYAFETSIDKARYQIQCRLIYMQK